MSHTRYCERGGLNNITLADSNQIPDNDMLMLILMFRERNLEDFFYKIQDHYISPKKLCPYPCPLTLNSIRDQPMQR